MGRAVRDNPILDISIILTLAVIAGWVTYKTVSDYFIRMRTTPDQLQLLIEQGRWDKVDKMLLFVHRYATADSFCAKFQSTVVEKENDGMPNYILGRVATMRGYMEPANRAFELLIRRQAWAEVRRILSDAGEERRRAWDGKVSSERVGGERIEVNYFETLGLETRMDVSEAELQKAKKRMIRMYHPDHFTNGGPKIRRVADEETKRIIEAYEVLKNPTSRRRHFEELTRKKS